MIEHLGPIMHCSGYRSHQVLVISEVFTADDADRERHASFEEDFNDVLRGATFHCAQIGPIILHIIQAEDDLACILIRHIHRIVVLVLIVALAFVVIVVVVVLLLITLVLVVIIVLLLITL